MKYLTMITYFIILIIAVVLVIGFISKEGLGLGLGNPPNDDGEYQLIKKYVFNENPLSSRNKPKLWIHSTYERNARNWDSFQDRNSTELNQPYVEHCIQSVINYCADDFTICLINDETFSKIIPRWEHDMAKLAEPKKSYIRQKGLLSLLYYYGGIIVPDSFICFKSLEGLFKPTPFVCEVINRTTASKSGGFVPSVQMMGVREKRNPSIKEFIDTCFPGGIGGGDVPKEGDVRYPGDTENKREWQLVGAENRFTGNIERVTADMIAKRGWFMWDAEFIGNKSMDDKKPVLIEDLMEEDYLDINPETFGILVPSCELLKRPKYNWLNYIGYEDVMKGNMIMIKYINRGVAKSSSS